MNFLINTILGGAGKALGISLSKILGLIFSDKLVATIVIGLAEALVKSTKNKIDDKAVAAWKEQIIAAGINIK